jgi:nitrate/TMAO reductase-like tetraheme cytochrome c subunit
MFIKTKRDKKYGRVTTERKLPVIDLNNIRYRNAFIIFVVGTTILLFVSAVGSYEAYNYTESSEFCGQVCHEVMNPEWTAYQNSPHARVACVDCHVGSGADWYVRSKLSGLYQVYSVLANKYPEPIPTPIENLRPAQATCEQCHWPKKFYSSKLRSSKHYLGDKQNTEWNIDMVMKIGPSHSALGLQEGIHWHINPDVKIEYVYTDEKRQDIPWVRYTNRETGETTVYKDQMSDFSEDMLDTLNMRTMDCIDCHNRPSHNYKPPAFFVNNAFVAGTLPKDLPELKKLAMQLCEPEFGTMDSAMNHINKEMDEFYKKKYPKIYNNQYAKIEKAKEGLKAEYKKNIFPEMKVRWSAYPNNIGHVEFDGCFRCHNGNHMSEEKNVAISKECQQCHTIKAQGPTGSMEVADMDSSLTFKHPVDVGGAWEMMLCTDCHTGLNP